MKLQLYRNTRPYIALLLGIRGSDCLAAGKIIYNELDVKRLTHKYKVVQIWPGLICV